MTSDDAGEFRFDTVPLGEYSIKVELTGFAPEEQKLALTSGRDARNPLFAHRGQDQRVG